MEQRQNLLLERYKCSTHAAPLIMYCQLDYGAHEYLHALMRGTLSTWYCINEGLWAEEQYGVASTRVHPR